MKLSRALRKGRISELLYGVMMAGLMIWFEAIRLFFLCLLYEYLGVKF